MKTTFKLLATAGATALLLASPGLKAESTYGYSAAGAAGVTATARVNINVTVPTLILLRVGAATGESTLNFSATPNATAAPTSATLAALTGDTSNAAANWDGTAPTFSAPTGQTVRAYAWTNSAGGGQLGLASVVNTALTGIDPAAITVDATGVNGAMPAHPANTATNANFGTFTRNTLHAADWTYSVDATALNAASAGTYEQVTTYTASAL